MKKKLLVIDDDPDILRVLKANLELYGYGVLTAERWFAAQELLKGSGPDLIILDLMLPDADGIAVCKHLRSHHPTIPIIMLTAKDRVSDKVAGLESGADDYIVKPFETLELVARVKSCLRRGAPAEETVSIGDLHVDFRAREVTVRGRKIELTHKEYELLRFFIDHRGEVVTRDRIRENIWKSSTLYSWSRVIDVHVQHLRQKIEKNPADPEYILTVPATGYKFKP